MYADALDRSGGYCERCGKGTALECAHLIRRWKLPETTVNDVAMLCGPSVNSGTCHNWIDYTAAGREWARQLREQFWRREIHNDSGKFPELPKMSAGHREVNGVVDDG